MIQIGKTLISEEVLEEDFVCNLTACKGACCVEGEYGAPLTDEETRQLESEFEQARPYLRPEGIAAIERQGSYVRGEDGEWETPLVDGKECAYTVFDSKGTALCGWEQAFLSGAVKTHKPISCHLYPIRITEYTSFTAVNYHRWEICDPACQLGASLEVPVYRFVKEALVRKFGTEWYNTLERAAELRKSKGDGRGGDPNETVD